MVGDDLAALLVWQSNYMTPCEAFAVGLVMIYAAMTILMSCQLWRACLFWVLQP